MYYLYKLIFPNGVHFGADKSGVGLEKISMTCHCDTFFSALCIEILNLFSEEKLKEFVEDAKQEKFLISDLMPFKTNELFVPKPTIYIDKNSENATNSDSTIKKKMKKLNFIPVTKLSNFLKFIKEGGEFPEYDTDFGKSETYEKVQLSRSESAEDNALYSVGAYYFYKDNGLYFIAKFDKDKKAWFDKVLLSLSHAGIGGKRTSGYGRFELYEEAIELSENSNLTEDCKKLAELLKAEGEYYMTLSASYPKLKELDKVKEGFYTLIKRQGYIYSTNYADTLLKKVPTVMLNIGSCFKEKITGDVADVQNRGAHPVYKYGKPIMIGINL